MEFIFLLIGVIIGVITTRSHFGKKHIYGHIDVDSKTGQCRIHLSSNDLENKQIKRAILFVNHDIDIPVQNDDSRDEPLL